MFLPAVLIGVNVLFENHMIALEEKMILLTDKIDAVRASGNIAADVNEVYNFNSFVKKYELQYTFPLINKEFFDHLERILTEEQVNVDFVSTRKIHKLL